MALLATTLLAACSKVPDGILSEKKMQGVLMDMLLAEAMVNVDYNTYKSDTMKLALYESVFRKHDITQAVYDSSLVWYGRNLDIYMEVYNRVLADLNKRINNLGDVQADAAPVSNRDSVDIWPRRSGSSFVLGVRVWGLNNKMAYKPEVRLSADQGDTTLTVNSKITKDGYHETILKTIPTKKVKRVFGYIRMDNMDTTYYKVYIDSLSLMKYNYGKELAELPKDSIK